jgi:hypothetical protein
VSIEQILLLVVFIVLPLVQYLLRTARRRAGHEPEDGERQPSPMHRPAMDEPPPSHTRLPPVPAGPLPPATTRHTLSDAMTAREHTAVRRAAPPAPGARRSSRPRTARASLRNPFELRRAIALMTILEQSRAANPYEWPEGGGGGEETRSTAPFRG